jgi:DNA-binding response OmpR family regulator
VIDAEIAGAGLEICRVLRTQTNAPIMVLSSRADEAQLVSALENGADDYLRKPFGPRTFVARVRALARRGPKQVEAPSLSVGPLQLDTMEHALKLAGGGALTLTEFETRLLFMLMSRKGRKLSTEQLIAGVWGSAGNARRTALKQLVYRVRKKLRALGATSEVQITHDGGYRLATAEPPVATR